MKACLQILKKLTAREDEVGTTGLHFKKCKMALSNEAWFCWMRSISTIELLCATAVRLGTGGEMSWKSVCKGAGCSQCSWNAKPTLQEIQEGFKEQGLILLEREYVNSRTPMQYCCKSGHKGKMLWSNVKKGSGCLQCAIEKKRTSIQDVQEGFRDQGLTLLETKYVHAHIPMLYRCDAGHEGKMTWNSVQRRNACTQCVG